MARRQTRLFAGDEALEFLEPGLNDVLTSLSTDSLSQYSASSIRQNGIVVHDFLRAVFLSTYFTGTSRFSSSSQLRTMFSWVTTVGVNWRRSRIRNRFASGVMS